MAIFFSLFVQILSVRLLVDCEKERQCRQELISALCVRDRSYSELQGCVSDLGSKGEMDKLMDEQLTQVACYVIQLIDMTVVVWNFIRIKCG